MASAHSPQTDWPKMWRHSPMPLPMLPAAADDAVEDLFDALAARPRWTVPCRAAADPSPWTSEDPDDAEWAAEECLACPVFALCERYGIATRAEGVVLAGRVWDKGTAKNFRRRTTTTTSAPAGDHREEQIA